MEYTIRKTETLPDVNAPWDSPQWSNASAIRIDDYITPGHDHKPRTHARLLHDGDTIAVHFHVVDQYVIAKALRYQDRTHKDSCVEFFIEPVRGQGYFNFEFNCCGILLLSYIEDPTRRGEEFEKYTMVPEELVQDMRVHASLQGPILEEIQTPVTWTISYHIPKSIFEAYVGGIRSLAGMTVRGNFYKCADESSHPHWGYWADIGDVLDFHQPKRFLDVTLEA